MDRDEIKRVAAAVDWVTVEGATFSMGREGGLPDEAPSHVVTLDTFRVAPRPVSNAEYGLFVQATSRQPLPFADDAALKGPAQPAVGVSWFDANDYLAWLAGQLDTPCRLPSEAEREAAARGGSSGRTWPWGDESPDDRAECRELMDATGPHEPRPGCANAWGISCMADNVHEWCSDWYGPSYYEDCPGDDPRGPASGTRRASRGGSWRHRVKFTAVAARSSLPPHYQYADYGFRAFASGR